MINDPLGIVDSMRIKSAVKSVDDIIAETKKANPTLSDDQCLELVYKKAFIYDSLVKRDTK